MNKLPRSHSTTTSDIKVDADSEQFHLLLKRIEQNYSRLSDRLDELEVLVPETLEHVSSVPRNPK
jgi:hypothetical protein